MIYNCHGSRLAGFSVIMNWNPLIPSLVGGLITGTFAILATWFTYRHNVRLNKKQQQRRINGTLRAIRYEMEIAGMLYMQKGGGAVEKLEAGKPYQSYFSLTEDYFIVYPKNTDIVGQLEDPELCKTI